MYNKHKRSRWKLFNLHSIHLKQTYKKDTNTINEGNDDE